MNEDTNFQEMAVQFNNNISDETLGYGFTGFANDQYNVCIEEWKEFREAYGSRDPEGTAEEMADVLVTLFVLADRMGIDLEEAYRKKMEYNLQKTGERDESGKVTDDSDAEKPDFNGVTW